MAYILTSHCMQEAIASHGEKNTWCNLPAKSSLNLPVIVVTKLFETEMKNSVLY